MKVLGEGRFAVSRKFCLYDKTGLIFMPDTKIINQQLEFSATRVKYLDHEKKGIQT